MDREREEDEVSEQAVERQIQRVKGAERQIQCPEVQRDSYSEREVGIQIQRARGRERVTVIVSNTHTETNGP